MTHNKPTHEIRIGKIHAAIWVNRNGKNQMWYSVTIRRTYFDGQSWQDTHSFGRDDLPLLAKISDMAYAWIWDHYETPNSSGTTNQQSMEIKS